METLQEPLTINAVETSALLDALIALKKGKTGVRLPASWTGLKGRVADAFNDVVELNERLAEELGQLVEGFACRIVDGFAQQPVISPAAYVQQLRMTTGYQQCDERKLGCRVRQ